MEKINSNPCKSCPFTETGLKLTPEKMAEIYEYLIEGVNHLCHSDRTNNTVCRGGRNYQLDVFSRLGIIDSPSDESLANAMSRCGVTPRKHIA